MTLIYFYLFILCNAEIQNDWHFYLRKKKEDKTKNQQKFQS